MSTHINFEIETFELGAALWHACIRNIDRSRPIVIDGIELERVHVGIAFPTSEAALIDARAFVDRMRSRVDPAA